MSNLFNLAGKTALVTGCNKGIGLAMTLGLAEAGAGIIGVSASLGLEDSEVGKEVKALGRPFTAYQADLTDRDSTYSFIARVKEHHPRVDILGGLHMGSNRLSAVERVACGVHCERAQLV